MLESLRLNVSDQSLGDILMLSEGVRGVDNVFSLKDGMHAREVTNLRAGIIEADKNTLPQES
jgi:hypothetical protein